jgi:hypothetical protein
LFIVDCNCAKTPLAENSSMAIPMTADSVPVFFLLSASSSDGELIVLYELDWASMANTADYAAGPLQYGVEPGGNSPRAIVRLLTDKDHPMRPIASA